MQIEINRNTPTILNSLNQWRTYEALHEGLPTQDINVAILEKVIKKAHWLYKNDSIYLIEPDLLPMLNDGPFSEFSTYPRYTCVARLLHPDGISTITKSSSLVVIWMQEHYALPVDELVLKKIKLIDWDAVAGECNY